jgi:NADH:ubiquinone oxidoreductase subunit 3 (subunit A)
MQIAFLPVFLFAVCAFILAIGLLIVTGLLNPGRPGRVTRMPYESGMDPVHDTRRRFDVRFHLLAIAFLVFDVELLFLYPWAVAMGRVESSVESGERRVERWLGTSVPSQNADKSEISNLKISKSQISNSQVPNPQIPKSQISNPQIPKSPTPSNIDAAVAGGLVESRDLVFGGAMLFLLILTLGFIYDWRKGIFQWR